jgi:hypothetical protein
MTMKPYKTFKLTECPDVGDIQEEGRSSHIGKLREKSGEFKPYTRAAQHRKAVRRTLKRRDKARQRREEE